MTRVGLIIPSSNRQVEQEMVRWYPEGVQAHVTRLRMTGEHRLSLDDLLARVGEAAAALDDARCDAVAFHCTANSMEHGLAGEERLLETLQASVRKGFTTTASAVRSALAALGARRIVLITPYDAHTTEEETAFLGAAGYEVVAQHPHALAGSDAYCATPPAYWAEAARRAARPDADVYFLSCANIACLGEIDALERALERPVVTSNQMVLWKTLREAGSRLAPAGLGRLFAAA